MASLLEMMLDENSGIRLSDVNTLFNNVAANSLGNDIATNFLVNRWDDIANSRWVIQHIKGKKRTITKWIVFT